MGHAFLSPLRKSEIIAGLAQQVQATSIYGGSPELRAELSKLIPDMMDMKDGYFGFPSKLVLIDKEESENWKADIEKEWEQVSTGGYLCMTNYNHKHIELMRAVEAQFPLLDVMLFPDSVAVIEKT